MRVPPEQFFLFLGATDSESATSRLRTDGRVYRKKMLQSRPANWRQILDLLRASTLQGVLATLTGTDYERILTPDYAPLSRELLDAIAAVPHIVFIHEAVFLSDNERPSVDDEDADGSEAEDEYDLYGFMSPEEYFGKVPEDVRRRVNEMLSTRDINVVPYRTNAERSVLATAFLDDHERHLLFRIYVPSGRLYASEADTLLGLFRDWLSQTGRNAVRQDGYRTPAGQVYEFFGSHAQGAADLTRQFQDFSEFLDACVDRPDYAVAQLESTGVESRVANELVARYGKATRRLHLDLRQAREQRLLSLRHELEAELLDRGGMGPTELLPLLEALIPPVGAPGLEILAPAAVAARGAADVRVIINQQVVGQLSGNVIQNVQGSVKLGAEAKELIALIGQFGGEKAIELESAVHELEDSDARAQDRVAARQKLRRFLASLGTKAANMTLLTLHKYLEQRLGIG